MGVFPGQTMTRSVTDMDLSRQVTLTPINAQQHDPVSLSVDDIYQLAEGERARYSAKNRRQAVAAALSQPSPFERFSRPNTSASRYLCSGISRRDTMTPKSAHSEPLFSRPSSSNIGWTDNEEPNDNEMSRMSFVVSPIARDCCEIIGPHMCRVCKKLSVRERDRQRSEARFPSMRMSEQNITSTAIIKRYCPQMSYEEIQDKLSKGGISRVSVPISEREHIGVGKNRERENDFQIVSKNKPVSKSQRPSFKNATALYFTNIRDLNHKLITGRGDKSMGLSVQKQDKERSQKLTTLDVARTLFPTFISPRKASLVQEPKYKAFYEPPLLPKENQKDEPSFFAGSDAGYKLPDRLPDELVFVKTRAAIAEETFDRTSHIPDDPSDMLDYETTFTDRVDYV